jgi:hypothetical protein
MKNVGFEVFTAVVLKILFKYEKTKDRKIFLFVYTYMVVFFEAAQCPVPVTSASLLQFQY